MILPNIYRNTTYADPSPFANTYSVKENVYNSSASRVVTVFAVDDEWTVLTRAGGDTFFVYTGLRSVLVKEKDNLREGDWLGLAQKDEDTGMFMISFGICKAHRSCFRDEVTRFLKSLKKPPAPACSTKIGVP